MSEKPPGRLLVLCLKCGRKWDAVYGRDEPSAYAWSPPADQVHIITTTECPPCRHITRADIQAAGPPHTTTTRERRMTRLNLTDEEIGLLYAVTTRAMQAADRELQYRGRRRRGRLSVAERAARALARSLHAKVRKAMPRGSARAVDKLLLLADRI